MTDYKTVFAELDTLIQKMHDRGTVETEEQYQSWIKDKEDLFILLETLPDDLWDNVEESRDYYSSFFDKVAGLDGLAEEYASLLFMARILEASNEQYQVDSSDVSQYLTEEVLHKTRKVDENSVDTDELLKKAANGIKITGVKVKPKILSAEKMKKIEAYDTDSFYEEVELVEYKGPVNDTKPSKKRRSNSKNPNK